MGKKMEVLAAWYLAAHKERRAALAKLAKTSVNTLWQLGHGNRRASAEKAALIESAAKKLGEPLRRGDVCEVCNKCPYYTDTVGEERPPYQP